MNKKLLSGLCAAVLLSGLVGCGPKESKQNTTTSTSTIETKNTTTNNSEVTEKNFKDFPETDEKYFTYDEWQEGYVIYSCTSDDKVVRVPKEIKGKPVIAIGERGLANLKNCEAIVLPDTVRYLSKAAFAIDGALKYVYLGKSIETVEDDIFNGCSSLEEVTFPEGTKSIGTLVFWGTKSIKSITIPASVTEITDIFYFVDNCNPDVEIHTPKGSKAEEVAKTMGLKVVND
ncbi:leucine-rich repeat domain-containing protein [Streptococcus sp. Marseille-Q6470]|uniref:leucine-rich repeat domain-containing protein n=1 Tax=Streptococcus infantis TaxID=68892 RepID=UPI0021DFB626|nr:leucine-rich repeat domain-containing protein [Streptococcus sp. Marseille-Q6470]